MHACARGREQQQQQITVNHQKKVRLSQEINAENVFIVSIWLGLGVRVTTLTSLTTLLMTSQPEPPIDVSFEYRNRLPKFSTVP